MNGTTIILWITIFIIGVIAIILVKLHYRGAELEKDEKPILSKESINNLMPNRSEDTSQQHSTSYSQQFQENVADPNSIEVIEDYNPITEVEENNYKNIEYESQNQILINYENQIKKTQEPMKEYQVEIMTQDNNEKHELKDLFTIDELIKESKRKDSEREKEAQRINNEEDEELNELKESIRKRKENEEIEDKLIEEILADEEIGKILEESEPDNAEEVNNIENVIEDEKPQAETIENIISEESEEKSEPSEKTVTPEVKEQTIPDTITKKPKEETIADALTEEPKEESVQEVLDVETIEDVIKEEASESENKPEVPSVASPKDIEEAITTASQEVEEKEIEEISESHDITDALLNSQEESVEEEIKEPTLKTPTKVGESEDNFGSPIDDSNLFKDETANELDYRNDLNKIKNTIRGSKLFQDVKERLRPEHEPEVDPIADLEENYIRNVNEYEDEYAPIINETHDEFGEYYEPDYDEAIRQENTRKLFESHNSPAPKIEVAEPKTNVIKSKPSRDNIKIQINNSEEVLKKGDEIIFKHDGETYSSQVYAINGDEISVRYRRKDIKIKPEDVKKIY
ncbi:hypothetical protein [uncultured Methanobrevibacter sp.]|uniref:hypothetical protein n=1 Tax=uncultured Methanobrevibacter sp. TaxID=253161 RepID=UPI0025E9EC81|nr:hypothetical protein [uncultured Methanobrevibacter sp.]